MHFCILVVMYLYLRVFGVYWKKWGIGQSETLPRSCVHPSTQKHTCNTSVGQAHTQHTTRGWGGGNIVATKTEAVTMKMIYPSIQIEVHKVIHSASSPVMIMMVILMMVTDEVMVMKLGFYINICEYVQLSMAFPSFRSSSSSSLPYSSASR